MNRRQRKKYARKDLLARSFSVTDFRFTPANGGAQVVFASGVATIGDESGRPEIGRRIRFRSIEPLVLRRVRRTARRRA